MLRVMDEKENEPRISNDSEVVHVQMRALKISNDKVTSRAQESSQGADDNVISQTVVASPRP